MAGYQLDAARALAFSPILTPFSKALAGFRQSFARTIWVPAVSHKFSGTFSREFTPVRVLTTASGFGSSGGYSKRRHRPSGPRKSVPRRVCVNSVQDDPWQGRKSSSHRSDSFRKRVSTEKDMMGSTLKVAVVGCAHGELEGLYGAIRETEQAAGIRIDVVICAGDFQAVRNEFDLQSLACPVKYRDMRSFWKYYAGHLVAPIPTIFIGGNHEASNHLQEIPLGGLVAPNIYFLGYAGVVNFRGLRIAGVSGTYVDHAYRRKRTERPPYVGSSVRSVYHMREEDVSRVLRLRRHEDRDEGCNGKANGVDVMLSHDWPRGITDYGNVEQLLRAKPFLATEIAQGSFGNAPMTQVLHTLQPKYWFSAHMHVKFAAVVTHETGDEARKNADNTSTPEKTQRNLTKFLALDKILPRRDFLQVLDIPVDGGENAAEGGISREEEGELNYDLEWLTILRTEAEDSSRTSPVTDEEVETTRKLLESRGISLIVRMKSDFERITDVYSLSNRRPRSPNREQPAFRLQSPNIRLFAALGVSAPPDYVLLTCPTSKDVASVTEPTDTQPTTAATEEGCTTSPAAVS